MTLRSWFQVVYLTINATHHSLVSTCRLSWQNDRQKMKSEKFKSGILLNRTVTKRRATKEWVNFSFDLSEMMSHDLLSLIIHCTPGSTKEICIAPLLSWSSSLLSDSIAPDFSNLWMSSILSSSWYTSLSHRLPFSTIGRAIAEAFLLALSKAAWHSWLSFYTDHLFGRPSQNAF